MGRRPARSPARSGPESVQPALRRPPQLLLSLVVAPPWSGASPTSVLTGLLLHDTSAA